MPVKNAEATIKEAIESILQQTFNDFELLIIDDHSTDNTMLLAAATGNKAVKLIDNNGTGIAAALNTGIDQAQGQYLARMDADDIAHPQRLEKQLNYLQIHQQIDVVSCLTEHRSQGNKRQEGYAHHVAWLNNIITPDDHYLNRFVDAPLAHPTAFFKAELTRIHGSYSEAAVPEDYELWLRWFEKGVNFAKVPAVLYTWVDYPGRASRTDPRYRSELFYQLKAEYFSRWWSRVAVNKAIWIWGYGKDVFRKAGFLSDYDITIQGYYDIREHPHASRTVRSYKEIQPDNGEYILIYVSDRQGKKQIQQFLDSRNMLPIEDYMFMA